MLTYMECKNIEIKITMLRIIVLDLINTSCSIQSSGNSLMLSNKWSIFLHSTLGLRCLCFYILNMVINFSVTYIYKFVFTFFVSLLRALTY